MEKKESKNQVQKNKCIIKSNSTIRDLLFKRIADQNLLFIDVVQDARKRGRCIDQGALSRYMNKNFQSVSTLSQENILWLCVRYGVDVQIEAKYIGVYNEKKCLERLKHQYPQSNIKKK